jgi:osmotically-inducible protein OsmY
MRPFVAIILSSAFGLTILACGGGEEPAEEETSTTEDTIVTVADSIIERDVQERLDVDPRLDDDEIEISVRSEDGEVRLVGQVPSRLELSIARDIVMGVLGVRGVLLDSLDVLSEMERGEDVEAQST